MRGFRLSTLTGRIVWGVAIVAALLLAAMVWTYRGPGPAARDGDLTTVTLAKGSGVGQIAEALAKAGVIGSKPVFLAAVKMTGATTKLKAGEYEFASRTSMARVLADIRGGKVVRHVVAVPEGWTSDMARDAVNEQPVLTGVAPEAEEGTILPDTYQVQRGEDRAQVIARMQKARDDLLADLWARRKPSLPFQTPEEAVTLASIVEKETALASERPRIAAVFLNRMQAGMRLESDPTTIYGITKGRPLGRGLRVSELAAPTPYNTYFIRGLPPTPIANPGREALKAVLDPPTSNELFFVADGTGGHVFAPTYEQHLRNVARWREVEAKKATK